MKKLILIVGLVLVSLVGYSQINFDNGKVTYYKDSTYIESAEENGKPYWLYTGYDLHKIDSLFQLIFTEIRKDYTLVIDNTLMNEVVKIDEELDKDGRCILQYKGHIIQQGLVCRVLNDATRVPEHRFKLKKNKTNVLSYSLKIENECLSFQFITIN